MINQSSVDTVKVIKVSKEMYSEANDLVVREEPLEIRLGFGPENEREQVRVAVTMRTPGSDFELAIGFLYSEGVINDYNEVRFIEHCLNVERAEEEGNVVKVELQPGVEFDPKMISRNFFATSSCGVCGKGSIESLSNMKCTAVPFGAAFLSNEIIYQLSEQGLGKQTIFRNTGGIHAATLFGKDGNALLTCEDVGRHNAVDKIAGTLQMNKNISNQESILLLSGRAGFELIQKAVRSQIPVVAAIGAPSSLAVELAQTYGLTLIGFLRENRFNIYSGNERFIPS